MEQLCFHFQEFRLYIVGWWYYRAKQSIFFFCVKQAVDKVLVLLAQKNIEGQFGFWHPTLFHPQGVAYSQLISQAQSTLKLFHQSWAKYSCAVHKSIVWHGGTPTQRLGLLSHGFLLWPLWNRGSTHQIKFSKFVQIYLSLVFLLISYPTNRLFLHQFLGVCSPQ